MAQAGQLGRITVATNMAGRGTDIKLGPSSREKGGLHVIATELHESARIDRQLFGRCGRQGDPGSREAIVSLEDELIRLYLGPVGKMANPVQTLRSGSWRQDMARGFSAWRSFAPSKCTRGFEGVLKMDDSWVTCSRSRGGRVTRGPPRGNGLCRPGCRITADPLVHVVLLGFRLQVGAIPGWLMTPGIGWRACFRAGVARRAPLESHLAPSILRTAWLSKPGSSFRFPDHQRERQPTFHRPHEHGFRRLADSGNRLRSDSRPTLPSAGRTKRWTLLGQIRQSEAFELFRPGPHG